MGERGARPSRRDLLAGAVGGVAGLATGAGLEALRGAAPASPASADLPFVVGKESSGLPEGLVRADLRAYHVGSGSDYHNAFAAALEAADVVYIPPGVWVTRQTIAVGTGKVLWSDGAYDRSTVPVQGAIIRAGQAMAATVRMAGAGATISGLVVDGADSADAALEFAADELQLNNVSARRGVMYALKATGDRCCTRRAPT